ncbi:MAG TPA: undecaprenyl-diphosphatase UppP [Candidatus Limnocylindrales bacterium]|jgi:undecaprenyl-diphosphatase|nr:undecaprenyl-diphosphatase UppP [Candidatus Limnocylindrales bacterium]
MDTFAQAIVMGIVQGLTEFLPVSSSGHLIIVPALAGWNDPFLNSLAFSVMLHIGTLAALLLYFQSDWRRLIPAGLAALRDRSLDGDGDRRLAWLIAVATIPALMFGLLLNDLVETRFREVGLVAVMLVVGGAILWLADRRGSRRLLEVDLTFPKALAIGGAQALALVPGISRSGISISAGLFAGLDRQSAARFSFLMATPVTAAAAAYETFKVVRGDFGLGIEAGPLVVGMVASLISGLVAIAVLLRFLRTRSTNIFVAYRIVVAAIVLIVWLS